MSEAPAHYAIGGIEAIDYIRAKLNTFDIEAWERARPIQGTAHNAAIDALSEDLRQAITLREIEGLSYEEIAELMNCPIDDIGIAAIRDSLKHALTHRVSLFTEKNMKIKFTGGKNLFQKV